MLFEVNDLLVASPATVSRCGMVYMTPEELGWRPYVQSWIERIYGDDLTLNAEQREYLYYLFDQTVDFALDKIKLLDLQEHITTVDIQRVTSLCNYLEVLLQTSYGFKGEKEEKKKQLNYFFAFAYMWGIGASFDGFGKERIDDVVREQFKACAIPPGNTCFDYMIEVQKKEIRFVPWANKLEDFVFDKETPFFSMVVPTVDTFRHSWCLDALLEK